MKGLFKDWPKPPKTPSQFYDDQGSTSEQEFCDLPEYYPNWHRASYLQAARALEVAQITGPVN